jgi:hypothetical protein
VWVREAAVGWFWCGWLLVLFRFLSQEREWDDAGDSRAPP